MKLLKRLLFAFSFSILCYPSFAQMGLGKYEDIQEVYKRRLIVVTETPSEAVLAKLKKRNNPSDIEAYKADVARYNEQFQQAIEKFWPYKEAGVEYKTAEELKKFTKKTSKIKYTLMYCSSKTGASKAGGINGLNWSWDMKRKSEDKDFGSSITEFNIMLLENYNKVSIKTPLVYFLPLPDVFPTTASIVFALNSTRTYFELRTKKKDENLKAGPLKLQKQIVKENAPRLQDLTLLIREDWLNPDLTEAMIQDYYHYPTQVVSKEDLDSAIITKRNRTAYLILQSTTATASTPKSSYSASSTSGHTSVTASVGFSKSFKIYIPDIFETATGDLLVIDMPSMARIIMGYYSFGFIKPGKSTVSKKNFKSFEKMVAKGE